MPYSKERWIATGDPRDGTEVYDDLGFEILDDELETCACGADLKSDETQCAACKAVYEGDKHYKKVKI